MKELSPETRDEIKDVEHLDIESRLKDAFKDIDNELASLKPKENKETDIITAKGEEIKLIKVGQSIMVIILEAE